PRQQGLALGFVAGPRHVANEFIHWRVPPERATALPHLTASNSRALPRPASPIRHRQCPRSTSESPIACPAAERAAAPAAGSKADRRPGLPGATDHHRRFYHSIAARTPHHSAPFHRTSAGYAVSA